MEKDCIFCRIVAGEIPCQKVYEDGIYLVFLDKFPKSPGHSLVIPKQHVRWVWDVENIGSYFEVCRKIAQAQRRAFKTEMIVSHVIGDEIPHAHVWLVPQHGAQSPTATPQELATLIAAHIEKQR